MPTPFPRTAYCPVFQSSLELLGSRWTAAILRVLFDGPMRFTDILDTVDGFTGKVMLPVGALLTSIFIGWKADETLLRTTTGLTPWAFGLWRFLIAWLCPIAVAVILVTGLFPSILGG